MLNQSEQVLIEKGLKWITADEWEWDQSVGTRILVVVFVVRESFGCNQKESKDRMYSALFHGGVPIHDWCACIFFLFLAI